MVIYGKKKLGIYFCVLVGDFFEGEIPPADLYILARIIHDWKEEKNLKLLRKIHSACHSGEKTCH